MTLYSYKCPAHGVMEIRHPMAEVGLPRACPLCTATLARVYLPTHHWWPSNHRPGNEHTGQRMFLDPEFQARTADRLAQSKEEHVKRTVKEQAK